ncbi:MAG: hypothetical protein NE328_20735 [Lentisphaeraceae bacterium]|nr:hypothetical protein [Lentisphaeraceae bacterium]
MKTDNEQLLCDYIFGLLSDRDEKSLEARMKSNSELAGRFKELNEIFCGLDTVKEEYPSPVSKLADSFYRLSYAGATMASALTIFWVTVFGSVKGDFREASYSAHGSDKKLSGISCVSGIGPSEKTTCQFNDLANFRE